MNRTIATNLVATNLAVFACITVGVAANAQVYSTGPLTETNSNGTFGDISVTQTKVGNVTPLNFVSPTPLSTPEISTTGLAAGSALGLFALSRFIFRKK